MNNVTDYFLRDLSDTRKLELLYEAECAMCRFRENHIADNPNFELLYDLHLMKLVFNDDPEGANIAIALQLSRHPQTYQSRDSMTHIAQLLALSAIDALDPNEYRRQLQKILKQKYGGKRGAAKKIEQSKMKKDARVQWTIELIKGGTTKHLRKLIAAQFNVSLRTAGEILKSAREVSNLS